ncbi:hypothetical protein PHYBLDRAFT_61350 [Phycomyces blakesleeanus NRRL 1555(-)]|uniref:Uncharacterized protein n=1 Tax=Phycomyces blakesleeanus (strain ATCC 8743b / DSM 1359 / FGSC 10004 / NBRC 33097 / NRRL 1555) TaxID=763407 RepID=A0A167QUK9_PHYB8|nr:hypothetical protein PHYBLDRAFT_61350 [Phycomyces blakesleeanus NRRL 1555(-)]OAD80300.1 hypothetical protein PHYBLDRAFT_61350 [Phycomyces blakesleeanus NRRL 1555(-)]|eukprot:XP_018298340.1 hypothetical protein PHYBLDRAFT_61350 [Phycomyces blakesleeanus NRRL 1555(-)]
MSHTVIDHQIIPFYIFIKFHDIKQNIHESDKVHSYAILRRLSFMACNPKVRVDNKEITIRHKYTISITSYAERYELLSLKCDAISLDTLLFIGLFTHIKSFSFFRLLIFPEFGSTSRSPIELFHDGKKATICDPIEPKYYPPPGNVVLKLASRLSRLSRQAVRKVPQNLKALSSI